MYPTEILLHMFICMEYISNKSYNFKFIQSVSNISISTPICAQINKLKYSYFTSEYLICYEQTSDVLCEIANNPKGYYCSIDLKHTLVVCAHFLCRAKKDDRFVQQILHPYILTSISVYGVRVAPGHQKPSNSTLLWNGKHMITSGVQKQ